MKKQYIFSQLLWVVALCCAGVSPIHGQTPRISMQGTLTDAAGQSVSDGEYMVTFRLYTTPTGGTSIWQESSEVTVAKAIYSHYLGSVVPLDASFFINKLYLGLQLDDSDEITPRTELTYSPYAFAVKTAKTVICSGSVGDVKHSILNPAQFAEENGACWVPMDGAELSADCALRQLTGMTTLPDAGGLFVRGQEYSGGQDNDPDRTPDSDIAEVQNDAIRGHSHTLSNAGEHSHSAVEYRGYWGNVPDWIPVLDVGHAQNHDQLEVRTNNVQPAGSHTHSVSSVGGVETRVKNLNFWIYICIN